MEIQKLLDTEVYFDVDEYTFRLQFYRCNSNQKNYGVYDVAILMNGENILNQLEIIKSLLPIVRKNILKSLGNAIDIWCQFHPNQFLTFFDCLSAVHVPKLSIYYLRFGFICDNRGEIWFTFVDSNGKRITFKNMLNLIDEEDYWINDIWRACQNSNYYEGNFYPPADILEKVVQDI